MVYSLKKTVRNIYETIGRFPVPILGGFLAFIFITIDIHWQNQPYIKNEFICMKLFFECVCGISLFTAFSIFSEKFEASASKKLGLLLLGISVLGLHYFSIPIRLFESSSLFLSRFVLFFISFHLLTSLVAFQQINEIKSFWQYNQTLFTNFIVSLLFSIALYLGFAGALLAVDKLFGFNWNDNYYIDLASFIFLVFNTIFFLLNFPKTFDSFRERFEYKKWLKNFTQYVLLPIVIIYGLILYVYLFKILMYNHFPKGWICIPVLVFSILGTLSYLLIYPIRLNRENQLIHFFSNFFFYTLLPLLSIYFISIVSRIKSYGVTEDRYLVLVLGIWLLIISVYIISSKIDNIIVIPFSLLVILFLSATGPWGMFQLSINNQFSRLERNLKRNGLLNNGKLVSLPKNRIISDADIHSIHSILDFLNKRGAINIIKPWLDEKQQTFLQVAIDKNDVWALNAIFSVHDKPGNEGEENKLYTIYSAQALLDHLEMNIEGYTSISEFNTQSKQSELGHDYVCRLIKDKLVFDHDHDTALEIDLNPLLEKLNIYVDRAIRNDSIRPTISVIDVTQTNYALPSDSLRVITDKAMINFSQLLLYKEDSSFHLQDCKGYLIRK